MLSKKSIEVWARRVHGDWYVYPETDPDESGRIKVICRRHGPFYVTLLDHLINRKGCPKCGDTPYQPEDEVRYTDEYNSEHVCRVPLRDRQAKEVEPAILV